MLLTTADIYRLCKVNIFKYEINK